MVHGIVKANAKEILRWTVGRRRRVRVSGESMEPTLKAGEFVLVDEHAYRKHVPRPGDIVLAAHPYRKNTELVKRVLRVHRSGVYELCGDNPYASTDSRDFGLIGHSELLGRVTARLR